VPKRIIKRYLPDPHKVRDHKHLQCFGRLLHDPNLWHLNRRSVAGAFFVGVFCAFIPLPFQMVDAAIGAVLFRVNLPISVALVWITNPLTIPPMFYFAYKVGAWVMGQSPLPGNGEVWVELISKLVTHLFDGAIWAEVGHQLEPTWKPLLLGSFIVGTVGGALAYALMRGFWRWHVVHQMRKRAERRHHA